MILKPGDNRLIRDFEDLVDVIMASTQIDPFESAGDKRKKIDYLLNDFLAFCVYYFPEYCYAPFAWFHKSIPIEIFNNPNNIYLEQLSRGFTKSTLYGLFFPIYIKCKGKLNGMIAGSLNENMAGEKLADIQANLQFNQRIINDFGVQFSYGNWEDGSFKTRDDVAFYAFGKKQSPRGYRFKWKRPNYGLVDDLNDTRQLKNLDIANEDKRWVLEELKPALWTRCWWLVVAQNKFHDNAVTSLIENDEEIKSIVHKVNIVDQYGKSNWPENPDFSEAAINDLKKTEGAGFIRERMNTPFEEGTSFKIEWMNEWVDCDTVKYDSVWIHYLDPSYTAGEKSDLKAWVLLGKAGKYYDIIDCWLRQATSKDMWEHAYDVDTEHPDRTIQHCMEANFIQEEVHKKEYERVENDKGRPLRLLYDHRKKEHKAERIMTLQALFQRLLYRFNIKKKNSPDMKLLRSQLLAFEKGSRIHDDGPDALEGATWMIDRFNKRTASKTRSGKYNKNSKRAM